MSDLIVKLEAVKDEPTFVEFLLALAEDRKKDPDDGWQWDKIEDFLETAAAWAEDSKTGTKSYPLPNNSWKRCADIIFAGKIYE